MFESINIIWIVVGLITGSLLGFIYFYGLWLTLKQFPQLKNPALLMLASLVLRLALVLSGFYILMRVAGWQALLAGLVGLTLMRLILNRRLGPDLQLSQNQTVSTGNSTEKSTGSQP